MADPPRFTNTENPLLKRSNALAIWKETAAFVVPMVLKLVAEKLTVEEGQKKPWSCESLPPAGYYNPEDCHRKVPE